MLFNVYININNVYINIGNATCKVNIICAIVYKFTITKNNILHIHYDLTINNYLIFF